MQPNTIRGDERPDLGLDYRLDEAARGALIKVVDQHGLAGPSLERLALACAMGSLEDIPQHMVRQFGSEASRLAERTASCVENPFSGGIQLGAGPPRWYLWLLKSPDWYLLRFLERAFTGQVVAAAYGTQLVGRDTREVTEPLAADLNEVLGAAGNPYELSQTDAGMVLQSTEEDLLLREVIDPALRVLGDSRFARVKHDLEAALHGLRTGTLEGHERAIQEAAAAVEGALAVLMEEHALSSRSDAVHARWNVLRDEGVLAPHFEHLVTAASVIRNKEAGHSRQTTPRSADRDGARAAVFSACVAVNYLGSRLR